MKVLLGHLASSGDCLYATILGKQIKQDYPDCELTWAISSLCKQVLRNNPHVDHIWEVPVSDWSDLGHAWDSFAHEMMRRQNSPDAFDRFTLSQIDPDNFRYYDGTIRPSILRSYGRPITVPIDTIICLDEEEKGNIDEFVTDNAINGYENRILFECFSKSRQSYVTPEFALDVANRVADRLQNSCAILSSHVPIKTGRSEIIDGSRLSMRESAGLTHYCSQFVGCGSGLTVVATSSASKQLPNIQLLNGNTSVYASFKHDFEYWGRPTDHFVEMHE